ncbi:MAG: hypothetical protein HRU19_24630 [Pseudobacteriovorax sp.]|nr:hypothetical protein [Pseudobacteriovorax sp.]
MVRIVLGLLILTTSSFYSSSSSFAAVRAGLWKIAQCEAVIDDSQGGGFPAQSISVAVQTDDNGAAVALKGEYIFTVRTPGGLRSIFERYSFDVAVNATDSFAEGAKFYIFELAPNSFLTDISGARIPVKSFEILEPELDGDPSRAGLRLVSFVTPSNDTLTYRSVDNRCRLFNRSVLTPLFPLLNL